MYLLVLRAFLSTNSRMPSEVGRHLNSPCGAGCFLTTTCMTESICPLCPSAPSGAEMLPGPSMTTTSSSSTVRLNALSGAGCFLTVERSGRNE